MALIVRALGAGQGQLKENTRQMMYEICSWQRPKFHADCCCLLVLVYFVKTRLFPLLFVGRIPQPPGNKTRAPAPRGSYIVFLVAEHLLATVLGLAPNLRMGDLG